MFALPVPESYPRHGHPHISTAAIRKDLPIPVSGDGVSLFSPSSARRCPVGWLFYTCGNSIALKWTLKKILLIFFSKATLFIFACCGVGLTPVQHWFFSLHIVQKCFSTFLQRLHSDSFNDCKICVLVSWTAPLRLVIEGVSSLGLLQLIASQWKPLVFIYLTPLACSPQKELLGQKVEMCLWLLINLSTLLSKKGINVLCPPLGLRAACESHGAANSL